MKFSSLEQWLAWQERLHGQAIDLGLERVHQVLHAMGLAGRQPFTVVTVAGTNGKGSTVALLEAIYAAAGYRVGAYTSPHFVNYNERIRVAGQPVADWPLCESFQRVEEARGDVSLTYFEYGTLAAIDQFHHQGVDIALLEVGLGGRLDAVNVIDPDVAVVTSIGIDHTQWLGDDRDAIGREKAGIFRPERPAVCADPEPPPSLAAVAEAQGALLFQWGRDFGFGLETSAWRWWGLGRQRTALPAPGLRGRFQYYNGAAALMAIELLLDRHPVAQNDIRLGLSAVSLPGRFQVLPGMPVRILDVAHNPQAAGALAGQLRDMHCLGETHAVVGMLADKDIAGVLGALAGEVDHWYLADLGVERAASADELAKALKVIDNAAPAECFAQVAGAYAAAMERAADNDRIVAFGSFYTVGALQDPL